MYSGVARSSFRQHCWSGRGHLSPLTSELTEEGEKGEEVEEEGKGSLMRE